MAEPLRRARYRWRCLISSKGGKTKRKAPAEACSELHQPSRKDSKHRIVVPCLKQFKEEFEKVSKHYKDNRLRTTKYTLWNFIPKNLFEQFHRVANIYFLFIVVLNWIPVVEAFQKEITMIPLLVVLTCIAVKDGLEDYTKHKLDKKLNNSLAEVYSGEEGAYIDKLWQLITVGDFVRLSCNEEIPADIIMLYSTDPDGICYVETSSLDGETNLKQKQVVRGLEDQERAFDPEEFSSKIECEGPNNDLNSFWGFLEHSNQQCVGLSKENLLLRGCTVRNTEAVVGIVVYAGHETKVMLNNSGPRQKQSKLEKRVNSHILWCVLLLIVMCSIGAVGHGIWLNRYPEPPLYSITDSKGKLVVTPATGAFYLFWRMIILLQVLIPVSLYVSIEMVKLGQIYFIQNDIGFYHENTETTIQCRALNIGEDLGQIEYLFCDKTGTLTENKMVFRRCTVAGREYGHERNAKRLASYHDARPEVDDMTFSVQALKHVSRVKMSLAFLGTRSFRRRETCSFALSSCYMRELAFSSPIETDVVPDIHLLGNFSAISHYIYDDSAMGHMTSDAVCIAEFFIALAICNTVVVSAPDEPTPKRNWPSLARKPVTPPHQPKRLSDRRRNSTPGSSGSSRTAELDSPKDFAQKMDLFKTRHSSLSPGMGVKGQVLEVPSVTSWRSSQPFDSQLCYEAESPDEAALVHAARAYSCILQSRSPNQVTIDFCPLGNLTFQLLHVLPFDSARKRMSVVVRHPILKQVVIYTKGADSAIMNCLQMQPTGIEKVDMRRQRIKERTQEYLDEYARQGLRTLCIAMKVMSESEYHEWLTAHYAAETSIDFGQELLAESVLRLENNLTLLGATGIEDRLQEGVPDTIASLRRAGITIWMLTGDKHETAVNIAHACRLLEPADALYTLKSDKQEQFEQQIDTILGRMTISLHAKGSQFKHLFRGRMASTAHHLQQGNGLIIDGPTLVFALHKSVRSRFLQLTAWVRVVICCRATPLQKSQLVKLVSKELKVMTMAVGDGANDVSMIQEADVGIGISGQEGMQAVMASDFALAQFKHLNKLLLVHGHWCYTRLANMVLYFFYKNLAYVAVLFWFQFFAGFSGIAMTDQWSLIFFNLFFTSAPPIIYGVLEKDVSADVLLRLPELYKASQRSEPYVNSAFFMNLVDAVYQSLACFFVSYMTYADSDIDIFSFGGPLNTSIFFIILLHLVIESQSLTWIVAAVAFGSVVLYFSFAVVFGATCVLCNAPANPYWIMQKHFSDPKFYLVCILSTVVALLPRYMFRVIQGTLFPTPLMKAKRLIHRIPVQKIQLRHRGALV